MLHRIGESKLKLHDKTVTHGQQLGKPKRASLIVSISCARSPVN
jgi:hypothetical protein